MECGSADRGRVMDVDVDTCALDGSGRFYLFRCRLLSSVTVKPRKSWLLALASSLLGISGPALAQCVGTPDNVTCSPGGNPYASGINVDTNNGVGGNPINLTLLPGVNVVVPAEADAVNAANTTGVTVGSANITITADGVTINNTANPLSNNNTGLRIQSSGDAIIRATNTTIDVNGTASEDAILAFAMPNQTGASHVASVTWSGPHLGSSGNESAGIQADNRGIGNASVVASGDINVVAGAGVGNGTTQYGLLAHAGDSFPSGVNGAGDASVTYNKRHDQR
jgi:hypothetical protein